MKLTRPLISAPELRALLDAGQPVVLLDCGFDLTDAEADRVTDFITGLIAARELH